MTEQDSVLVCVNGWQSGQCCLIMLTNNYTVLDATVSVSTDYSSSMLCWLQFHLKVTR